MAAMKKLPLNKAFQLLEPGPVVLDAAYAWIDTERKERRTFHAHGGGTFTVDGRTIDHRELMLSKIPPGV
jgi:hypothetical protein